MMVQHQFQRRPAQVQPLHLQAPAEASAVGVEGAQVALMPAIGAARAQASAGSAAVSGAEALASHQCDDGQIQCNSLSVQAELGPSPVCGQVDSQSTFGSASKALLPQPTEGDSMAEFVFL